MANRSSLSPEQSAAVQAPADRPLLIEACPGSGKTLVLTHRAAWLVEECGVDPREILLIAFANRDVADLRAQLGKLLGHRAALSAVTTFHRFGHRLVRQFELASGGLDFDQMLDIPLAALRGGHPMIDHVRQSIRHVLVDEGQDLDARQVGLLRRLVADHGRLTVVGDRDQSVYQGLGALGLEWFAARYPAGTTRRLDDNYRSAAGIVAIANAVMGRAARPQRPAGPVPIVFRAADEWDEADFIAREIVRLRLTGAIETAGAVAILVRSAWQAPIILRALRWRAVPHVARIEAVPPEAQASPGALVTTIHRSKGGQWAVVFIPGLDEGTLPLHAHPTGRDPSLAARMVEARIAEERRLVYVAISRAIGRLYLSYPERRRQGYQEVPTEASRFLERVPSHLLSFHARHEEKNT